MGKVELTKQGSVWVMTYRGMFLAVFHDEASALKAEEACDRLVDVIVSQGGQG